MNRAAELTSEHMGAPSPCSQGLCGHQSCPWLMGCLKPAEQHWIVFLHCLSRALLSTGAYWRKLDSFLSFWKIWEAYAGKQGVTSFCKQRLSWEFAQRSLLAEGSWGHKRSLFLCTHGQAAHLHHFFHHLPPLSCNAPGSSAWGRGGQGPSSSGRWGLGWGAPRVLPLLVFVALPGCCSSTRDHGSFQTEWSTQGFLYPAARKGRANNSP